MILSTIIVTTVALMFWQPQMSADYRPTKPYRPTKLDRFKDKINGLLRQEDYSTAAHLLASSHYPQAKLPIDYWKQEVQSRLADIMKQSEKLEPLRDLEKMLEG